MKQKSPKQSEAPSGGKKASSGSLNVLVRKHLRIGWTALLLFLTLGIVLESLHGFKVGFYLDVSNQTRRFMWTLAHAHGTLLALVNLAFAMTVHLLPGWSVKEKGLASTCFLGATILMPAGFFLGGVFIYGGDPGLGIFLLPVGAVMLLVAVFKTAAGIKKA
jgi:hypothetical protein